MAFEVFCLCEAAATDGALSQDHGLLIGDARKRSGCRGMENVEDG